MPRVTRAPEGRRELARVVLAYAAGAALLPLMRQVLGDWLIAVVFVATMLATLGRQVATGRSRGAAGRGK